MRVIRQSARRATASMASIAGIILGTMAVSGAMTASAAEPDSEFYLGKQVKFVVGSAGGGGYEFYSRLVTRHMSEHIPGKPLFVVQAMPGAAGIISANYLYNVAARDGSEMGMVGRAVGTYTLLNPKDQAPKYDATKFNWIGSPQSEVGLVLVRQPSPIRSFSDLKTHELIVSGTSTAAPPSFYPRLFNKMFGTKFKVIEGYKGSQAALLALERGEVSGHSSGSSAAPFRERIAPWLAEGKVKVVGQIGLKKDPAFPDVSIVTELASTEAEHQMLELILAQQIMAWPIVAPPDVPAARVNMLRKAFDAAMEDKNFLADAAKQKLIINPVDGETISHLIVRLSAYPKDVLEKVAALTERK